MRSLTASPSACYTVSKITWDGLTPADHQIVRKTAVEVMAWQKQGARAGLD